MSENYTIGALARRLGIKPDTLRAWERRYGLITPQRSVTGRRLYDGDQLRRLELVCAAVRQGHAISIVATQDDASLGRLVQPSTRIASASADTGPVASLMARIEQFDDAGFEEMLNRLVATLAPWHLIHEILIPLMQRVGDAWHAGDLTIAQEHLVSVCLRNLIGSLLRLHGPSANGSRLLLATLSGERHEFGILMAGMVSAALGIRPVMLGSDLPVADIAHAAQQVQSRIVVIGLTYQDEPHSTAAQLRELRGRLSEGVALWIGGPAAARLVNQLEGGNVRFIHDLSEFREAIEAQFKTGNTGGRL